jgi:hypothetical protein
VCLTPIRQSHHRRQQLHIPTLPLTLALDDQASATTS